MDNVAKIHTHPCQHQPFDPVEMEDLDLNSLFAQWLDSHSKELSKKGSKLAFSYAKAHDRVKSFDQPITLPKQLKSIQYVGDKTYLFLCSKLKKHCEEHSLEFPFGFASDLQEKQGGKRSRELDEDTNKTAKKLKKWVPKRRSGSWAILVTLLKHDKQFRGMRKEDIIKHAAQHCDTSFTSNPSTREFYSAWDGIKTLTKRELVETFGRVPKLYRLTELGETLALLISQQEGIHSSPGIALDMSYDNGLRVSPDPSSPLGMRTAPPSSPLKGKDRSESATTHHDRENRTLNGTRYDLWEPKDYEVVLVFDNREMRSKTERDFFHRRISDQGISCEVMPLAVGDILWLARHRTTGKEVVLNYVCERKRLDDLASSIKDGRFIEQKNRLRRSAIKNVYYVVEEGGLSDVERIIEMRQSIITSISTIMTVSNLFVRRFRKIDELVEWLVTMTEILKKTYEEKRLVVLKPRDIANQKVYADILDNFRQEFEKRNTPYECVHTLAAFQDILSKTNMMTVKDIFLLMLMLVRGISMEKAVMIQSRFPTPKSLIEFYKQHHEDSEQQKEMLMANLFQSQIANKKISKAPLTAMYEAWGKE